ncbi:hypothetical protein ACLESO_30480 [Pyxidicoccus sp. 3LG]
MRHEDDGQTLAARGLLLPGGSEAFGSLPALAAAARPAAPTRPPTTAARRETPCFRSSLISKFLRR